LTPDVGEIGGIPFAKPGMRGWPDYFVSTVLRTWIFLLSMQVV
jgi:hypothetical protein